GILYCWMAVEIPADQLTIPGPFVGCRACRMNTHQTLPFTDIPLKSRLLICIEQIARSAQENKGLIRLQALVRKKRNIFRVIHIEPMLLSQLSDYCSRGFDVGVAIAQRFGKYEHLRPLLR